MKSKVKERLKVYNRNSSIVKSVMQEIEEIERTMEDPQALEAMINECSQVVELGMPKAKSIVSIVEKEVDRKEQALDTLKKRKKELLNEVWSMQKEVERIESAIGSLGEQQRYIVECRYFVKKSWRATEIEYNNRFCDEDYISEGALKMRLGEAIGELSEILEPFYETRSRLAKTIGVRGVN